MSIIVILFLLTATAFASGSGGKKAPEKVIIEGGENVTISDTFLDSHKKLVGEAVVVFMILSYILPHNIA